MIGQYECLLEQWRPRLLAAVEEHGAVEKLMELDDDLAMLTLQLSLIQQQLPESYRQLKLDEENGEEERL